MHGGPVPVWTPNNSTAHSPKRFPVKNYLPRKISRKQSHPGNLLSNAPDISVEKSPKYLLAERHAFLVYFARTDTHTGPAKTISASSFQVDGTQIIII